MKPTTVTKKPSFKADTRFNSVTGSRQYKEKTQATSGQIPTGDIRLTANIRRDLHKWLKDAATQRQYETGKGFTIGELIEEMIETHMKQR